MRKNYNDFIKKIEEGVKAKKSGYDMYIKLVNTLKCYVKPTSKNFTFENIGAFGEIAYTNEPKTPAQPKGQKSNGDLNATFNGQTIRAELKIACSKNRANGQHNGTTCKYVIGIFYNSKNIIAKLIESNKVIYADNHFAYKDNVNLGVEIDLIEFYKNHKIVVKG